MPIKTFTSEVLTSSDVNTYLMKQAVMVFSNSTARSAAITSPSDGMVTYLTATDALEVFNGSAWVSAVTVADGSITEAKIATNAVTNTKIANGSVTAAKLSGMYGVTYADQGVTMSTTGTFRLITIPSGKSYTDIVSIIPYDGTNDIVYIYAIALGNWSGVQNPNQVTIYCHLGNGVASSTGIIRFYFRA